MASNPDLRGTLSAYAKWAGISIQTACMRNRRGQIVMCEDLPWLVDFVRSNECARSVGRPKKPRNMRKIHINARVTIDQWQEIQKIITKQRSTK